jgi:hypothetical protein
VPPELASLVDDHHHFIDGGLIADIENGTVRLSANADVAITWKMTSSATPPAIWHWPYRCRVGAGQRDSLDSGHHLLAESTLFFRRNFTTEILSDAIRKITRVPQCADRRITYVCIRRAMRLSQNPQSVLSAP